MKRVLLKLSGEALAGDKKTGFDEATCIGVAKQVKELVDDKTRYTDWDVRIDVKAELEADLMILLDENGYPPGPRNEVYNEVFEQAENFKKYN